jgi:alkylation response protein AidB-like acyl-CoA dehydrogenase
VDIYSGALDIALDHIYKRHKIDDLQAVRFLAADLRTDLEASLKHVCVQGAQCLHAVYDT